MVTLNKDIKEEEKTAEKEATIREHTVTREKNNFHVFPAEEVCEFRTEEIGGRHEINSKQQTSIQ